MFLKIEIQVCNLEKCIYNGNSYNWSFTSYGSRYWTRSCKVCLLMRLTETYFVVIFLPALFRFALWILCLSRGNVLFVWASKNYITFNLNRWTLTFAANVQKICLHLKRVLRRIDVAVATTAQAVISSCLRELLL